MDLYTAINARRTIRDFDERPVDMQVLEKIIDAGLKAPTNDHMRDWKFIIINDKADRAELLGIIPEIAPSEKEVNEVLDDWGMTDTVQRNMYLDAIPKQYSMLYNAGCLILPFFQHDGVFLQPESMSDLNGFASIWCCIENMLLAAAAEGIFGVTRIPGADESQHIKSMIGHPDDYVLPCYVGLGYPRKNAFVSVQKQVSVKDKMRMGRWQ